MEFGLVNLFNWSRWRFQWRYRRGRTPWDTSTTPPEVKAFIAATPAGRALDLGCGTGTNAISLARHGWQVTGVDFVPEAIRQARAKATENGQHIHFYSADVTDLDAIAGPFDYGLDIGCLFCLAPDRQEKYAAHLLRLLRPGAWYMLYAWLPRRRKGGILGLSEDRVEALLKPGFKRDRIVVGQEKGFASAWYWYRRT